MKKMLKILLKTVVCLVAILVIAVLALPLWIGPVGKTVANSAVPGVVGTDFHLGILALNPYSGHVEVGDLQLNNPNGYSEKYAATLGDLTVDLETSSLMTDVIHVRNIVVKDVFVSYVSGGADDVNNFKQIQYNVAGGKEKYEAEKAAAKAEEEAKKDAPKADEPEAPSKKVIIDHLQISGVSIKLGPVPIRIPVDITLNDIGKKSGGATLAEAWEEIYASVCNAAGALGEQLKAIGDLAGEAAKQAQEAATQATKAVGEAAAQATKAVSDVTGQATKAVGDVTGQATKALGGATEGATKAVSGVTEGATKAVGGVTEGATKAVSGAAEGAAKAVGGAAKKATEGATKALDSLKSLW